MSHKIGITGGIGSGKSIVSRILRIMGIPVYDCDCRARCLMGNDPLIRSELINLLGTEAYLPDGSLNKDFLAGYLFSSEDHTRQINAIVHPRVRADFNEWTQRYKGDKVVALETALLLEAAMENEVDTVWLVTAPLDVRVQRAIRRDTSDAARIHARIARQIPQEELEKRIAIKLLNDESCALLPQILQELKKIGM